MKPVITGGALVAMLIAIAVMALVELAVEVISPAWETWAK
jgi:hypothetical protein